jgi:hypothetical protein
MSSYTLSLKGLVDPQKEKFSGQALDPSLWMNADTYLFCVQLLYRQGIISSTVFLESQS